MNKIIKENDHDYIYYKALTEYFDQNKLNESVSDKYISIYDELNELDHSVYFKKDIVGAIFNKQYQKSFRDFIELNYKSDLITTPSLSLNQEIFVDNLIEHTQLTCNIDIIADESYDSYDNIISISLICTNQECIEKFTYENNRTICGVNFQLDKDYSNLAKYWCDNSHLQHHNIHYNEIWSFLVKNYIE